MAFEVPPLPYDYAALEPHIDEATMRVHHDKHHQAYVDKANAALEGTEFADKLDRGDPQEPRRAARRQAEGRPQQRRRPLQPQPVLGVPVARRRRRARRRRSAEAINGAFGSFDDFKAKFKDAGVNQFGSGWAWLVHDGSGLAVTSTPNQDSPLSRRPDAAAGRRRVGARVLPQVPEQAPGLPGRVLERRELEQGRRAVTPRPSLNTHSLRNSCPVVALECL